MHLPQEPLDAAEESELRRLLAEGGGALLEFARGVFHAAASTPSQLTPPDWLGLVLGESADPATLKRTFALLMRDYNACVECLALGVPAVPAPGDAEAVKQFCRGYVRVTQKDPRWNGRLEALELTLPFAVLAGFIDGEQLHRLVPELRRDPEGWLEEQRQVLSDSVARVFSFFAEARRAQPASQALDKVGRNEPCPCGSGKKFKKCCGVN